MFSATISEAHARLLATYALQGLIGLLIGLLFYHFSQSYNRKFLSSWAYGWFAFTIYMVGMFLLTEQITRQVLNRTIYSGLSQLGAFLHVFFLLRGTLEFMKGKPIRRLTTYWSLAIIVALAIGSVLLWHNDPAGVMQRYVLRYGLRTLIASFGFMLAAYLVWTNDLFIKGFAQKMLAGCFLLYSLDQGYYFTIIVLNAIGFQYQIPSFFGLLDISLISFVGMSMVIWLLENERDQLRKANQELDSFLYSTSHDLRAPLASILGLTNISKFDVQDEASKKLLTMIEDRAKKMDLVIEDILSLARSKKGVLEWKEVDFNQQLQESIEDANFMQGASSIKIIYEPAGNNRLWTDPNQLKIVLNNLLSNAIKYHKPDQENPFVKIDFVRDEHAISFSVEDNGAGIPAQSQARIFDMFYRASINSQGTGLGLYISKQAIQKLGGSISFVSTEGQGSIFTVKLPVQQHLK